MSKLIKAFLLIFNEALIDIANLILWFLRYIIYRLFMKIDTSIGNIMPVMIIVIVLTTIVGKVRGER